MGEKLDLDRVFLLLSVAEKAATHDPVKYRKIYSAAVAELDKMMEDHENGAEDTE